MKELLDQIHELRNLEVGKTVNTRLKEFKNAGQQDIDFIFKELCFCVMTANCGAEKCLEVHEGVGNGFLEFNEEKLSEKFKELGYRFPNVRSGYIVENRDWKQDLENMLGNQGDEIELRNWIVKNIKGLGYKEASHFLRNIGFDNFAIVDRHIVDILVEHDLIERPKTMTKRKYLEIEELLKEMGMKANLTMAELDLYLWYLETGMILK